MSKQTKLIREIDAVNTVITSLKENGVKIPKKVEKVSTIAGLLAFILKGMKDSSSSSPSNQGAR